jgi:hypothetical protein
MTMAHVWRNEAISLDDLHLLIGRIRDDMREYENLLALQPAEERIPNLRITVGKIGSTLPRRPPFLERYMVQWREFESGRRTALDKGAVRYLCWEPDIATDAQFLRYLQKSGIQPTVRLLAGLVRSCHLTWGTSFLEGPSLVAIGSLLDRYERPSPIIEKWKSNMDAVLDRKGPAILGRILVVQKKVLRAFLEEWYLEPRSPFVQKVVQSAAAWCRDQLATQSRGLLKLLFSELLPWPGWKLSDFKEEIGALILHGSANGQTREILQRFVLIHRDLGDPRLPATEKNWAGVAEKAKERVLQWLSENPFSSLDRVYREDKGWFWRSSGTGTVRS